MSSILTGLSSWVSAGAEMVTALSHLTHSNKAVDAVKGIYTGIGSLVGKAVDKAGPTALTGVAASYHGYKGGALLLKSRNGFADAEAEAKEESNRITNASGAIACAKANNKRSSTFLEHARGKQGIARENYQRSLVAFQSAELKVKKETTEQQLAIKVQKEQGKVMPWFTAQAKRLSEATVFINTHFKPSEETVKTTTSTVLPVQTRPQRSRDLEFMTGEYDAKALVADFTGMDGFFDFNARRGRARRANTQFTGPRMTEEQIAEKVALDKKNGVYLTKAKAELTTATTKLKDANAKWQATIKEEEEAFKHFNACSTALEQANAQLDQIRTGKDLKKELREQAVKDRNEGLISLGFAATEAIPVVTGGTAVTSAVGGTLSSVAGAVLPPVAGAVALLSTPIAVEKCFSAGSSMINRALDSDSNFGRAAYGLAGGAAFVAGAALTTVAAGAVGTAVSTAGAPVAVTTAATVATAGLALTGAKVAKWACTSALHLSMQAGEAVLRAPSATAAVAVGVVSRAGACALRCLGKKKSSANPAPIQPRASVIASSALPQVNVAARPAQAGPAAVSVEAVPVVTRAPLSATARAVSTTATPVVASASAAVTPTLPITSSVRALTMDDQKHTTARSVTATSTPAAAQKPATAPVKPVIGPDLPALAAPEAADQSKATTDKVGATSGKAVEGGQVQPAKKKKKAPPKNQVPVTLTKSAAASFARTKAFRQHRANAGAPKKTHRR